MNNSSVQQPTNTTQDHESDKDNNGIKKKNKAKQFFADIWNFYSRKVKGSCGNIGRDILLGIMSLVFLLAILCCVVAIPGFVVAFLFGLTFFAEIGGFLIGVTFLLSITSLIMIALFGIKYGDKIIDNKVQSMVSISQKMVAYPIPLLGIVAVVYFVMSFMQASMYRDYSLGCVIGIAVLVVIYVGLTLFRRAFEQNDKELVDDSQKHNIENKTNNEVHDKKKDQAKEEDSSRDNGDSNNANPNTLVQREDDDKAHNKEMSDKEFENKKGEARRLIEQVDNNAQQIDCQVIFT